MRANKIGIIYQQDNLLADFTALENIYLASLAAKNNKELSVSRAKNLLKKVGLTNRSNHYPFGDCLEVKNKVFQLQEH